MVDLEKTYIGIEDWTYRNIISDLLNESQEVRVGELSLGSKFHIFHHNDCTIDVTYSGSKRMELKIYGENARGIIDSLDAKITEYNKEYCDPSGLRKSTN